jgi:NADP-reducing hydrogenase subunit HndC
VKQADRLPTVHFLVCGNTRPEESPLGRGCGLVGEHVYIALKQEVTRQGAVADAWVTKTACLGLCPKRGGTVAVYPGRVFYTEVEAGDAEELYENHAKAR